MTYLCSMKAKALLLLTLFYFTVKAQTPSSGEILLQLQRLSNPQRALYLAAHPDDENTRLIAWLANHKKAETAYLSLTRGDGGQNLIGAELGDALGLIRSHELVEARRIDAGMQFFSRARDFGYSKSYQETESIWNRDSVLADMVKVLRSFRPQVVITRFSPKPGGTHGHHTSSARLGLQAVQLAAQKSYRPDLGPAWQVFRTLWNTSWWFFQSNPSALQADSFSSVFVGHYIPERGMTIQEIAALARSQHKSQGFGTMPAMLDTLEYFQVLQGPAFQTDPLDLLPNQLSNCSGGEPAQAILDSIIAGFNPREPHLHVPALFRFRAALTKLADTSMARQKKQATERLIQHCLGIRLQALASQPIAAIGDTLEFSLDYGQGLPADVRITNIQWLGKGWQIIPGKYAPLGFPLQPRGRYSVKAKANSSAGLAQPYWLETPGTDGAFFAGSSQHTQATGQFAPLCRIQLSWNGQTWHQSLPLIFVSKDPVKGEQQEAFRLLPQVTLNPGRPAAIALTNEAVDMPVLLKNHSSQPCSGQLRLASDSHWTIQPTSTRINLPAGSSISLNLKLFPRKFDGKKSTLQLQFVSDDGQVFQRQWIDSRYDHIGHLGILPEASLPALAMPATAQPRRIAFLPGAGEATPDLLLGAGLDVRVITENEFLTAELNADVLLLGIRALNISAKPEALKQRLLEFAQQGGHVIVQYITGSGLANKEILPGLTLGRQRITDENAALIPQATEHICLKTPLVLTEASWKGWVQERGLYFAESWSSDWLPVLQGADPGEPQQSGMLLIRPYGKGKLVYTGLSFFRQLPAAVPGAYALLFNLLHLP